MSTELKLVVALVSQNVSFQIQRTDIGGQPVRTINIPDGEYYFLDDSSSEDLIRTIRSQVTSYPELSQFTIGWASDEVEGVIALSMGSGHTATLTWTADGVDLRDWMRFEPVAALGLGLVAKESTRPVRGLFVPQHHRSAISDLPVDEYETSQSYSDDRTTIETLVFAQPRAWELELGFAGSPFGVVAEEYHALRDVVSLLSTGHGFRYYRDRTNSAAWAEITEPTGYSQLKLDARDFGWSLKPRYGNYYRRWSKRLMAWETT